MWWQCIGHNSGTDAKDAHTHKYFHCNKLGAGLHTAIVGTSIPWIGVPETGLLWVPPGALGHYGTGAREECRTVSPLFIPMVSAGPAVGFEIGLTLLQHCYTGLRRMYWNDPTRAVRHSLLTILTLQFDDRGVHHFRKKTPKTPAWAATVSY